MDLICPNLVCGGHMTQYIAKDIQNEQLRNILIIFIGTFKKCLKITNLGHCSHMTWYILNIPDNIPSQDSVVTSAWYILNALNMCQFGMPSLLHPRPYNVLTMYWVSSPPLTPSASRSIVGVGTGIGVVFSTGSSMISTRRDIAES